MLKAGTVVHHTPGRGVQPREGHATGGTRTCGLDGCRGVRVGVRWSDGKLTWPCLKGMTAEAGWSVGDA